jgi:hypothetical protein
MRFEVTLEEHQVIATWWESIQKKAISENKDRADPCFPDSVYYGAMGGGLSYSFTPTSLGTILVVKEAVSGEELNVTDALGWKDW